MNAASKVFGTIWEKLSGSSIFWYVIFAFLAYWGYKRLTKPVEESFLDTPIPNGGKDIPANWSPVALVERLHNVYNSYFPDTDEMGACYSLMNGLNDGQFVYLCKYYNAKYAKKDSAGLFSKSPVTLWTQVNKTWNQILFGMGAKELERVKERMIKYKLNY